jgi:hypothetical protein
MVDAKPAQRHGSSIVALSDQPPEPISRFCQSILPYRQSNPKKAFSSSPKRRTRKNDHSLLLERPSSKVVRRFPAWDGNP